MDNRQVAQCGNYAHVGPAYVGAGSGCAGSFLMEKNAGSPFIAGEHVPAGRPNLEESADILLSISLFHPMGSRQLNGGDTRTRENKALYVNWKRQSSSDGLPAASRRQCSIQAVG